MTSVTLAVICKDEIDDIDRIIHDYVEYFDELHFAVDDQKVFDDCVEAYRVNPNIKFFKYEWINDFAHKRNWLADKCHTDYYFTIDSDDEIAEPQNVKKVAERAEANKFAIVYGFYVYATDKDGNVNAAHWKERLVKNTLNLVWNKKIHENIVPREMAGHNFDLDDRLVVKHLKTYEEIEKSNERNLKYLVEEWNQDKEKTDPRTIAYLGRVFTAMGDFKKGRYFLEKHIELSGWDEDRHLSWCQLSTLHRLQENYPQAIACAFEALAEKPDYPDGYLALHDIYFYQENWLKAIEWGEMGLKKEPPRNFIVTDPSGYTWRPALSLSYCYWSLGEFEKAMKLFKFAKKLAPSVEFIKQNEASYIEGVDRANYLDKMLWLINYLNENDKDKVITLVKSIPEKFFENETVALMRNKFLPPTNWDNNSVIIYCGNTADPWNPKSIDKGVGGSEEACIHLSKELTKLGYEVIVYNNCTEEGIWDGVRYLNHVKFNPKDNYNILIGWRCNPFKFGIQASKKIIWCHDIPNFDLTEDNVKQIDKFVMLSKYHASLLDRVVPDEKIFISTNGLVPDDFRGLDNIKREPHRIIYASSYDRGLETLLKNWGDIRKAVPDAELHCYYGWNTYDSFMKKGLIRDDGFKKRMLNLFSQEGIFEHGRIGHRDLLKEYAKSSILAYPCTYAGEINCLALSKAIACGCFPLTNDFAVMAERNTHGRVVKDDKYISSLITLLRKGDTKTDNTGYVQANSWEAVAKDWSNNLFPNEVETIARDRWHWSWDNIDKNKTIVDIGCNKGHGFEGWDRSKITSVDIDEYDLPNFVRANAEALPFEDNQFDQACLFEIVEHSKNPIKVLSEAYRVSKKLIITVPYEYEWMSELKPFNTMEKEIGLEGKSAKEIAQDKNPAKSFYEEDGLRHLWHETFYTPELLRCHLTEAGVKEFKIIKLRRGKLSWLGVLCQK